MKLLNNKVALVTGGSSGIGRASALAFSTAGAKVVVADVTVDGGQETVAMIKKAGGEASFIETDVSKANEVEALVKQTVEIYGRLDCAHNNAGVEGTLSPLHESVEEVWDKVINVNLKGVWLCLKYQTLQMLKQGGGAIVNTASVAGLIGMQGTGIYSASKHGVIGLTKTAALEVAQANIRVNAVCPGAIDTPMVQRGFAQMPDIENIIVASHPIGRIGKPEEVAQTVVWLCSDAASFITGVAMPVDGGFTAQ